MPVTSGGKAANIWSICKEPATHAEGDRRASERGGSQSRGSSGAVDMGTRHSGPPPGRPCCSAAVESCQPQGHGPPGAAHGRLINVRPNVGTLRRVFWLQGSLRGRGWGANTLSGPELKFGLSLHASLLPCPPLLFCKADPKGHPIGMFLGIQPAAGKAGIADSGCKGARQALQGSRGAGGNCGETQTHKLPPEVPMAQSRLWGQGGQTEGT